MLSSCLLETFLDTRQSTEPFVEGSEIIYETVDAIDADQPLHGSDFIENVEEC